MLNDSKYGTYTVFGQTNFIRHLAVSTQFYHNFDRDITAYTACIDQLNQRTNEMEMDNDCMWYGFYLCGHKLHKSNKYQL